MKSITIGQLAREAGVKVSTIRFYERSNLLTPPGRDLSGYRQYTTDSLKLLKLIIRSKELGFTLDEISELVKLVNSSNAGCEEINARTISKLKMIDDKIKDLQRIKKDLLKLQTNCPKQGPLEKCPIVRELQSKQQN